MSTPPPDRTEPRGEEEPREVWDIRTPTSGALMGVVTRTPPLGYRAYDQTESFIALFDNHAAAKRAVEEAYSPEAPRHLTRGRELPERTGDAIPRGAWEVRFRGEDAPVRDPDNDVLAVTATVRAPSAEEAVAKARHALGFNHTVRIEHTREV